MKILVKDEGKRGLTRTTKAAQKTTFPHQPGMHTTKLWGWNATRMCRQSCTHQVGPPILRTHRHSPSLCTLRNLPHKPPKTPKCCTRWNPQNGNEKISKPRGWPPLGFWERRRFKLPQDSECHLGIFATKPWGKARLVPPCTNWAAGFHCALASVSTSKNSHHQFWVLRPKGPKPQQPAALQWALKPK